MRKNTIFIHGLFTALLALALAAPVMAGPSAGPPVWGDSHSSAYLGVHIEDVTPQQVAALKLPDEAGAVITDIDQDGPACKAGLKENDVIVGFNGSKIDGPEQLGSLIHAAAPGKTVALTVIRAGEKKDVKVTLGSWPHMATHSSAFLAAPGSVPGIRPVPEVEIPSFATLFSLHGVMVESLCPQLSDFFGVPPGRGILVRSVEKGSAADAAGLKAGDVIVKVNNEVVHDLSDWRRSMRVRTSQVSVGIVRDKREQILVVHFPTPDSSKLDTNGWPDFDLDMQALREEMENIGPEIERQPQILAEARPNQEELEQMRRDIQESMRLNQKDMEEMRKQIQASVPSQQEMEKMRQEILKSMPSPAEMEQMRKQIQSSIPSAEEMKKTWTDAMTNMPSQADMEQMRRQIDESLKNLTPQLQQQMEEFRKEMEQHRLDLQEMMKGYKDGKEF